MQPQEYIEGSVSNSERLTDGDRYDLSPNYNEPMMIKSPEMEPALLNSNSSKITNEKIAEYNARENMNFTSTQNQITDYQNLRNKRDENNAARAAEVSPDRPRSTYLKASQKLITYS